MTGSHHLREPNHGLGEKESVLVALALSLLAAPYAYRITLPGPEQNVRSQLMSLALMTCVGLRNNR